MNKNKNFFLAIFFIFGILFSLLSFKQVFAAEEGIWINLSTIEPSDLSSYPSLCPDRGANKNFKCFTIKKFGIVNNINFNSDSNDLDTFKDFYLDRRTATSYKKFEVKFYANIYIPEKGDYGFLQETNNAVSHNYMYLGDDKQIFYTSGSNPNMVYYDDVEQGWHNFLFTVKFVGANWMLHPKVVLKWTRDPHGSSPTYELIPDEYFSWETHSDSEIVIPHEDEDEKSIGYYTAGVGVAKILEKPENNDSNPNNDINPRIKIVIPDENPIERGPGNEDFSDIYNPSYPTDGSYVFWYDKDKENLSPQITIQNDSISGDNEEPIYGTRIMSKNGVPTGGVFAQIPAKLIQFDEYSREMNFEIKGLNSVNNSNGVGIILPYLDNYIDPTNPSAVPSSASRLILKFINISTYHGTHSPIIFNLDEDIDNGDLSPLFFFPDGDTRYTGGGYRPNYMYALSGSNPEPATDAWLEKMSRARRLFPYHDENGISTGDPDSWYPVFGREGSKFDTLSSMRSYLPNEENSYIRSDRKDGTIERLSAGENDDWIAFQWYSSNFGDDETAGDPESGGISVIGFLGGVKKRMLAICTDDSKTIYKRQEVNFDAYFWDNYKGGENPCDDIGSANGIVTEEAIWLSDNESILEMTNESTASFLGVSASPPKANVVATYTTPSGLTLTATTEVEVVELETCAYRLCDETTGYVCKWVTEVEGDCSGSNCTDTDTPETCELDNPWKEVAP